MISFAGVDLSPPTDADDPVFYYWHRQCVDEFEFQGYQVPQIQHLPTPFFPKREPPRVGVLVWPTGADRFARCHLICTGAQAAAIRATVGTNPTAQTLTFDDGAGGVVSPEMYFLALRPISQRGDGAELYLLTLVDERWFWWQSGGQTTPTLTPTWESLLLQLYSDLLVIATVDPVPGAYLTPNPPRWAIGVQPLPLVAEAAATTVGLRTVRGTDGVVSLQSYATALVADGSRWAALSTEALSGGRISAADIARSMPASVTTVFFDGATISTTLASLAPAGTGGVNGVAGRAGRVTADALKPTSAQRTAYAQQAALDYYSWGLARTDATFRGFVASDGPCGLDEAVEWVHTPETMVTRIVRSIWSDRNIYGEGNPAASAPVPTPYPIGGSPESPPLVCVPDDQGYPDGCAPGDGLDPLDFFDEVCVLGVLYKTRGRKQIVFDGVKLRETWYDLETFVNGCCSCGTPGGSVANNACCPTAQLGSLNVALLGPFGGDCAETTLLGVATYQDGAWQGTITDGTVTAVVKVSCGPLGYRFEAIVTKADGTLVFVGSALGEAFDTLGALIGLNGTTDCDPAEAEVTVTHPCPAASGSASCDQIICDCALCPDGQAPCVTFEFAGAGDFANAPRQWVLIAAGCAWTWSVRAADGSRWDATLSLADASLTVAHYTASNVLDERVIYAYGGAAGGCCGGLATGPVLLGANVGPVPPEIKVGGLGPCGPCGGGSGGGVVVGCCASPVPVTLYAQFFGVLATLNGTGRVQLDWDGVSAWRSSEIEFELCGQTPTRVRLQCIVGQWSVNYGTLWTSVGAPTGPCSPMHLAFAPNTMASVVCPGSSAVIVTAS